MGKEAFPLSLLLAGLQGAQRLLERPFLSLGLRFPTHSHVCKCPLVPILPYSQAGGPPYTPEPFLIIITGPHQEPGAVLHSYVSDRISFSQRLCGKHSCEPHMIDELPEAQRGILTGLESQSMQVSELGL